MNPSEHSKSVCQRVLSLLTSGSVLSTSYQLPATRSSSYDIICVWFSIWTLLGPREDVQLGCEGHTLPVTLRKFLDFAYYSLPFNIIQGTALNFSCSIHSYQHFD